MKAFFLVFSAGLFVALSLLVFAPVASAASIYDDVVQTTDIIEIGGANYYGTCEKEDISITWSQLIRDWDTDSDSPIIQQNNIDAKQAFLNSNNEDILVFKEIYNGVDDKVIIKIFPSGTSYNFGQSYSGNTNRAMFYADYGQNVHQIKIDKRYNNSYNDPCLVRLAGSSSGPNASDVTTAQNPTGNGHIIGYYEAFYIFILASDNIVYPPGYDGAILPDTWNPEGSNSDLIGKWQPSFKISWNDKQVTLTDTTPVEKLEEFNIDSCSWQATDSNWDDLVLTGEITDCSIHTPWVIDVPTYENYSFTLTYLDTDGIMYIASSVVTIDGGSGNDSINDIFYSTLIGKVFEKHMATDYGLQKFILAPIEFVASLPSRTDNCQSISLPILNTTTPLKCVSPMLKQSFLSGVIPIYLTVLYAVTTYWVAVKSMGVIKDSTNPLHDKIDVLKL